MLAQDLFEQSPREAAIDALHAATAIYTCDPVVDALLDQISWPAGHRVLVDTSCGDGAFLCRALGRLLAAYPDISDEGIATCISGWEIHPFAADQARHRLRDLLVEAGRTWRDAAALAERIVQCGDFLTEGPRARTYHAIVGNPPYLKFAHVPSLLRGEYAEVLPAYAQADLLHSFLDRCTQVLHPDGELACVSADRWLFNEGAARLREVIGQKFRLAHLCRIDVTSAFYRPKQRRAGTPPRVHPCVCVLKASEGAAITRAPIYPGLAAPLQAPARTLGEIAEIRLGPWLGSPGIFLIGGPAASRLPADHLVPAIDTDDIKDGVLRPATRWAVLTRPDLAPAAPVLAHLERELPRMCPRGRRSSPHWLPPEPFHKWDLTQPSLLVPRIAKSLRAVFVPPGVLPVNHNLSIVRPQGVTLDDVAAALASETAAEWMQAVAAPLENGYRSLTTRLLRSMPVPG